MKSFKETSGFALMELLVVIAIIGILVAIVTSFGGGRQASKDKSVVAIEAIERELAAAPATDCYITVAHSYIYSKEISAVLNKHPELDFVLFVKPKNLNDEVIFKRKNCAQ